MLEERGEVVSNLRYALLQGTEELGTALPLLKQMLEERSWQRRIEPITGNVVEFQRFTDFMQAPPPEGLGVTFEQLWDLCYDDPILLDLLDQEVVRGPGAKERIQKSSKNADSSTQELERPTGTSRQAGLRRLRKQAPELHQKVLNGEISVNAALIKAGLRIKQITVFVEPSKAAGAILKAFQAEELIQFITDLILGLKSKTVNNMVYCQAISSKQIQNLIESLEEIGSLARIIEFSLAPESQLSLDLGDVATRSEYLYEVETEIDEDIINFLEEIRQAGLITENGYWTILEQMRQMEVVTADDLQNILAKVVLKM